MKKQLKIFTAIASLGIVNSFAATIVTENFGGLSTDALNGTTADTFDAAITSAGGSATWAGQTTTPRFNADGSITTSGSSDGAAYLRVGEYINNAKGAANGIFDLQATLTKPTAGNWVTLGFFTNTTQNVNSNFVDGNGVATALYRTSANEVDYFAGPQNLNTPSTGTTATGTQTIRINLDVSGYNGTTNFGTVSYFLGSSTTAAHSFNYTVANDFEAIGFTQDNGGNSTVSALSLTQIPEPSAAFLVGLSGVFLLVRRRK